MHSWINRSAKLAILYLPAVAFYVLLGLALVVATGTGWTAALWHGPRQVLSVDSPDGAWRACVRDLPSIDGPNQHPYLEGPERKRFLEVGALAEDSPGSRLDHLLRRPLGAASRRRIGPHGCARGRLGEPPRHAP